MQPICRFLSQNHLLESIAYVGLIHSDAIKTILPRRIKFYVTDLVILI